MSRFTRDIPDVDTAYARDISMPFRFNEECDILMDEDQEVIDQALILITFIPAGLIRLFPEMGSGAHLVLFDQLDDESTIILDTALRNAFESLEPRVFLDREFIFDESPDQLKIITIVPYKIKVTGELSATRLVVPRPGPG